MPTNNNVATGWVGWVYFAGILMMLRGLSDAFLGISALVNKHYLFITENHGLIVNTAHANSWGWVQLAAGIIVLAAGFSLLHGSTWARVLAVIFTAAAFLVNMAFVGVFPVWSIIAMIVDVVILYALIVHGGEAKA